MRIPLLLQVVIAVALGLILGTVVPLPVVRAFLTFNGIFAEYLEFCIPLIILALVSGGISGLGTHSGKLVLITVAIAYGSTLFSGFFTYFSCQAVFPSLLNYDMTISSMSLKGIHADILPYFNINIEPLMNVMTALTLAFVIGLGIAACKAKTLLECVTESQRIIETVIQYTIIPFLPLFIFGIFLKMTAMGDAARTIAVFGKVICVIFALHVLLLLIQYVTAGAIGRKNPFRLLWTMLPAYATALGTSSSAATIPVTLKQTILNGVRPAIAQFCVPLCATIHLAGSTMKITAFAMTVVLLSGQPLNTATFAQFICLLGITMVAAPGVPGGAIMAATAVLQSVLGFNEQNIALMITLYIATDSFGTACNVCGDGAISVVVDRIAGEKE